LISQGLGGRDPDQRLQIAHHRADEVLARIAAADPSDDDRSRLPQPDAGSAYSDRDHSDVLSNFTSDQFRSTVADVVRRIRAGDSFQVNLAQRLLKQANRPPAETYLRLRATNPAPFSAYYGGDDFAVLSSSPEGFLKVRDRRVETRPIKGTTSRSGDDCEDLRRAEALFASEKDRAENIMIVDLMRNDFSRVCEDDSVVVGQLCEVEGYQYVQHLVSVVQGRLRDEATVVDLLRACFPGGSVTGAPKIEAMRTIASLEPHHRGPYCGSIGYISCGGAADFNILIRTITAAHGYWQIPVGGGITARSVPEAEEAETWAKAEGMLRAVR
jgi:para-aminobenzoate synthetase component 1